MAPSFPPFPSPFFFSFSSPPPLLSVFTTVSLGLRLCATLTTVLKTVLKGRIIHIHSCIEHRFECPSPLPFSLFFFFFLASSLYSSVILLDGGATRDNTSCEVTSGELAIQRIKSSSPSLFFFFVSLFFSPLFFLSFSFLPLPSPLSVAPRSRTLEKKGRDTVLCKGTTIEAVFIPLLSLFSPLSFFSFFFSFYS